MVWAICALQSGRSDKAARFLKFPVEAKTEDLTSRYFVHRWKLETLLNEILALPKARQAPGYPIKRLNCSAFEAVAHLVNLLADLENADDALVLSRIGVLRELHRLAQRQFEWQRGFVSYSRLYRAGFVYGGELARQFFQSQKGLTLDDFTLACFALRAMWLDTPVVNSGTSLAGVGLSNETTAAVFNILTLPHAQARAAASRLRTGVGHIAYKRSLFRQHPCIAFGEHRERVHAPLTDLVTLRATSGVFYDVIDGGHQIRSEIGGRFEAYCAEFLRRMLPLQTVQASFKYRFSGNDVDSPDILVTKGNEVAVVFECKATRMAYEARYSEAPIADAPRGYEELAKGVFQIWRFVSHCRRNHVGQIVLAADAAGAVLTLDSWLSMSREMQIEVIRLATSMAAERDPQIREEDRIGVAFCSIEDLELTLSECSEESFFSAIRAFTEERYQGWYLSSVHQEVAPNVRHHNGYPFESRIAEVLPWWGMFAQD